MVYLPFPHIEVLLQGGNELRYDCEACGCKWLSFECQSAQAAAGTTPESARTAILKQSVGLWSGVRVDGKNRNDVEMWLDKTHPRLHCSVREKDKGASQGRGCYLKEPLNCKSG